MKRSEYEERLKFLTEQIESANEQIEQLKNEEIEEEDNIWRPKKGEIYWVIYSDSKIDSDTWEMDITDKYRSSIGNTFKTKEEASFQVEKLKVLAELNQFSREFQEGSENYYLKISSADAMLSFTNSYYMRIQGVIYFGSKEHINKAIETIGEDRIRKYIFGVE